MGFQYKQFDKKRYVYEQPTVIHQSHQYLRDMKENREGPIATTEGRPTDQDGGRPEDHLTGYNHKRPVVYLDDTRVDSHHHVSRCWLDKDGSGGLKVPSGKGMRLIVLHAGWKGGWIPNAKLIFKSGCDSEDYHKSMNTQTFMKRFEDKLIPNLPDNSIIALDNENITTTGKKVFNESSTSTKKADGVVDETQN